MGQDLEKRLARIKKLLRSGDMKATQELIRGTPIRRLPRKLRAPFAFTAREALLPHKAVEALAPVVRPPKGAPQDATNEEKLDYASSLTGIGLTSEARGVLQEFDLSKNIDAALAMVVALGRDLEFEPILPIIEKIRSHPQLDRPFLKAAFRLHGAGALIYGLGRHAEGRKLLDENTAALDPKQFHLIRHDTLLMKAASLCMEENFKSGTKVLDQAIAVFEDGKLTPLVTHRVNQWRAIAKLAGPSTSKEKAAARALVAEAKAWFLANARPHFARNIDFFTAMATGDQATLLRLHFASTTPAVSRRTGEKLGELGTKIPETLEVWLPGSTVGQTSTLDLLAKTQLASPRGKRLALKPDQLPFRLLRALAQDLYLRPNLPQLFAAAFPDEYYNPLSGPSRIATGLHRLRRTLAGTPLEIREDQGYYWIETREPMRLRLHRPTDETQAFWPKNTHEAFNDRDFSAPEFGRRFELSERAAQYRLKEAVADGWLVKVGRGRSTRYRLSSAR